jgi:hypothetical protein
MHCIKLFGLSDGAIRTQAWKLGLRLDRTTIFYKQGQENARIARTGIKKPKQSKWMKKNCRYVRSFISPEGKAESLKAMQDAVKAEHPRGYLNHKHGPETLRKLSKASKRGWANMTKEKLIIRTIRNNITKLKNGTWTNPKNMSNPYSRTKSGKRIDLDGQFFRSATEANYARFLNLFKINWEYEFRTFEFHDIIRGIRFYTPDFYLPDEDVWIEVKGWMDDKSVTRLKRFKKYYPKEFNRLTIVTESQKTRRKSAEIGIINIEPFEEIRKKFSLIIPDWER